MAYSQITINFNSMPNDGEVLNFSETNKGISLNEMFKGVRDTSGQTVIPTLTKGRYRKIYHQDDFTDNRVRYMPLFGVSQETNLGSLPKTNNLNGKFTLLLNSYRLWNA